MHGIASRPPGLHGLLVLMIATVALRARAEAAPAPDPAAVEFFEQKVRPVLADHCYSCHSAGAEKIRGDLVLDTRAGWQKGGASGKPSIVPGDAEGSLLIQAVRHATEDLAMPPRKKLAEEQIEALVAWVRMGAPDPRSGGTPLADPREQARHHWAFQPVREPDLPVVTNVAWVRNGIDRFILAKLEEKGWSPAWPADRRTLLRRATYVLTGLAPTPAELEAFLADRAPGAFERVVDRLLASPRYGERWARHWLDVARYADTKGYVFEEERRYPYAYTYRDYVIRSLNDDKPYDRFLKEQIAADQLDPAEPEAFAAMGFLTLGRRFLNNPHDIIDDRIDVVTRGTMGLTVVCARCHDHKYDPIPASDYYSLYGVFASSREPAEKPLLGTIPDPAGYEVFQVELKRRETERDNFNREKEEKYRKQLRATVGDYLLAVHDAAGLGDDRGKREELARSRQMSPFVLERWREALASSNQLPAALFDPWRAFSGIDTNGFEAAAGAVARSLVDGAGHPAVVAAFRGGPPATLRDVAMRYNQLFAVSEDADVRTFLEAADSPVALDSGQLRRLFDVPEGQRSRALQRAVEELQATHPGAPPRAMSLEDLPQPVEPVVFKRGNPGNRGPQVPRQFLEVLSGPDRKPFTHGSGRRELAEAIASAENPLTARVAVNRVWMQHFGAPLVRTPGDFGLRSEPPTHPELLDWLAVQFVREGWSLKRLHRLILLSSAWQQRSDADPAIVEADPDNRFLARQNRRRLDFEGLRDVLLQAAGSIDYSMGGHSVEITTRDYQPRRTVYGFVERQNLPGVFRTFDFASPDTTSAQRFQTTVPQQALFLLNSPFVLDQARNLAARPEIAGAPDDAARIERLYRVVFQREPNEEERQLAQRFIAAGAGSGPSGVVVPAWQYGRGTLDETGQRLAQFERLPHFTGNAWQGGPKLPDPQLGWATLSAAGGHPAAGPLGAVVRRWTASADAVVAVSGVLRHPGEAGDGVHGHVISSRHGSLGRWHVRAGKAETVVSEIRVLAGDTLDFVVACGADENTDSFEWSPVVRETGGGVGMTWDARADFSGPAREVPRLDRWERYAQVLLMANEAAFVD